jgi:hypothetical protein
VLVLGLRVHLISAAQGRDRKGRGIIVLNIRYLDAKLVSIEEYQKMVGLHNRANEVYLTRPARVAIVWKCSQEIWTYKKRAQS